MCLNAYLLGPFGEMFYASDLCGSSPKYSAALRQTTANMEPALGRAEVEKEKLKEAEMQVGRWRVSYGGMGSLRAERPRQRCLLRPPAPERQTACELWRDGLVARRAAEAALPFAAPSTRAPRPPAHGPAHTGQGVGGSGSGEWGRRVGGVG